MRVVLRGGICSIYSAGVRSQPPASPAPSRSMTLSDGSRSQHERNDESIPSTGILLQWEGTYVSVALFSITPRMKGFRTSCLDRSCAHAFASAAAFPSGRRAVGDQKIRTAAGLLIRTMILKRINSFSKRPISVNTPPHPSRREMNLYSQKNDLSR